MMRVTVRLAATEAEDGGFDLSADEKRLPGASKVFVGHFCNHGIAHKPLFVIAEKGWARKISTAMKWGGINIPLPDDTTTEEIEL